MSMMGAIDPIFPSLRLFSSTHHSSTLRFSVSSVLSFAAGSKPELVSWTNYHDISFASRHNRHEHYVDQVLILILRLTLPGPDTSPAKHWPAAQRPALDICTVHR